MFFKNKANNEIKELTESNEALKKENEELIQQIDKLRGKLDYAELILQECEDLKTEWMQRVQEVKDIQEEYKRVVRVLKDE